MTARLLSLWGRINASYWFYPALFSILAFFLALGTIALDRGPMTDVLSHVSWLVPARPGGASDMLQVIAGSTIGVAATVFSITIVAVSYASGTYGPRLLTNFMEDKGNQLALATFISTFVYTVMVLRVVRREDEAPVILGASDSAPGFTPQLSLLVATAMMLGAIGMLVYFLNHVPDSIRINTVLEDIGKRLIKQVQRRFPHEGCDGEQPDTSGGEPVNVERAGYIEIIDFDGLEEIAEEKDVRIVMEVEAGDFVHPPRPLLRIIGADDPDEIGKRVRDCFVLSGLRTPTQDLRFLLDELVEIALRALSPGINDPFTAVTALHWIGAATAELGTRILRESANDEAVDRDERDVVPITHDFADYVAAGFGSARSAVATSRKAAMSMYDALENCYLAVTDPGRRTVLMREGDRLLQQAEEELTGPNIEDVRRRHAEWKKALA
ncbi:DUF2254 domain-containing protein [Croceicoccus mobilis]|nr:DUF2254 domain-containing protein [Croceicoccus mobilis]